MQRRSFLLKASAVAAIGGTCRMRQEKKRPRHQLASAPLPLPSSAATLQWNGARHRASQVAGHSSMVQPNSLSARVGELTDGKFNIKVFAAGEIVPGLQVLDAVQNNTVHRPHCRLLLLRQEPDAVL
ncbi:hypothetical protein ACTMU2_37990 [Cupriavidus basilensis]